MNLNLPGATRIGRRAFLQGGTLILAAGANARSSWGLDESAPRVERSRVRFGVITDLHYADKPPAGTRYYRETPAKLAEAAERFRNDRPDFLVELGDFIDAADSVADELSYLNRINRDFAAIADHRHYILGNHCVDTLTKDEFLGAVGQRESFYSFDSGGVHFIVLDSCFREDGKPYGRKNSEWTDANIPSHEVEWLRDDLARHPGPTIVFAHQRLDVGRPYGVRNAPEIRAMLERSGHVRAVFQGHSHKNDHHEIAGIHYVTLVAMIEGSGAENSGYAMVELNSRDVIQIKGFRQQKNYEWGSAVIPVPSERPAS